LAVGFALRQFRTRKLASFGELIAIDFAGAIPARNFPGPLSIVGESVASVQGGGGHQNKNDYLHLFPHDFFRMFGVPSISGRNPFSN
jgi:hypothetical protein